MANNMNGEDESSRRVSSTPRSELLAAVYVCVSEFALSECLCLSVCLGCRVLTFLTNNDESR